MANKQFNNMVLDGTWKELDVDLIKYILIWTDADGVQISYNSDGANAATLLSETPLMFDLVADAKVYINGTWTVNYQIFTR